MSKHLPPDNLPFEKSAPTEPLIEKEAPVEAPVEKEVAQTPVTVRRQRRSINPAVIKKAMFWVVFAAVTALWGGAFTLGIVKNLTSPLGSSNATLLICLVCVLLVSLIALAYLFISGGFVKKFAESSKLSLPFAAFILTLAMSFTALISALGAVADSTRLFGAGATVYEENFCLYVVTAENEVCLYDTSLFGGEGLTVPEEVNGHKVTAIGERAFYGKSVLRAIEIPDSVTEVAPTAFTGCTNLSTASVPACAVNALPKANLYAVTVTGGEIAESAFEKCETLTYAELKGVTSIGKTAFARCKSLETLNVSDDVLTVGERAFYGCEKLKFNEYGGADYLGNADNPYSVLVEVTDKNSTAFTIRSETKTIAPLAFINCAISKINIPAGVRHIAAEAFNSRLTEITVDANNSYYRVSGNCLIEIATKTLVSGFSNSVIPADGSVTKIGNSAFANRSVSFNTLPDSITEIGDSAFDDCKSLSEFTVPENVKRIGNEAFGGCNNLVSLTLSEGLEEIGSSALRYCQKLTQITLPNSLKILGAKAFDFCSNLTEIKIPANVTEIGPSLFSGCYNLATVTVDSANHIYHGNGNCIIDTAAKTLVAGCGASVIPADGSVTKIGEGAFYTNYRITQIVIPDGVTEICDYAFDSCLNLTEITIPASVKKIGNRALANCKDLTAVYFKGTTAQWDKIEKYEGGLNKGWNVYSEFTVHCSDGTV